VEIKVLSIKREANVTTKIGERNILRTDLKASLYGNGDGLDLVLERTVSPQETIQMLLKADEWQELMDWVRIISLLHNNNPTPE